MLTALLKSNTIVAFALSYLLGIGLLVYTLLQSVWSPLIGDFVYTHWAFSWLASSGNSLLYISMVLVLAFSFISRFRIREAKKIFGTRNLATLALFSFIAAQPHAFYRPDVLMATLLSSIAFILLFSTYKQEAILSPLFHVALLVGLASLFVGQSLFLMVIVGFALFLLHTTSSKEWIVLMLGLLMALVFVAMVVVWFAQPWQVFMRMLQSSWFVQIHMAKLHAGHGLLAAPALVGLYGMFTHISSGTVAERNIALACCAWILGAVFMVLALGLGWQQGIVFAAFPLSVFTGKQLQGLKRWWLSDLLVLALLIAPFLSGL